MEFMKPTMLKTAFTVVLAGLSSYFGMLTQPLLVLFFAMVLDYLTGMTKAYIFSQLSSRIGVKGILKKLCYMAMVAVGAGVDYLLRGADKICCTTSGVGSAGSVPLAPEDGATLYSTSTAICRTPSL